MKTLTKILATSAIIAGSTFLPGKTNDALNYFTQASLNTIMAAESPARNSLEEEIVILQEKVKQNPNDLESRFNLAVIYHENKRINDAIREYNEIIRISPEDFQTHFNLGVLYQNENKLDDAIKEYKKATKVEPEHIPEPFREYFSNAHLNLGSIYFLKEDFNNAKLEFERTVQLKPACFDAYIKLGIVYEFCGLENKALESIKKGIEIDPINPSGGYILGSYYLKHQQLGEAEEQFNRILKINQNSPQAMIGLAGCYAKTDLNRAFSLAKKALEINPNLIEGRSALGSLYLMKKDFDNAVKEFDKAIRIIPNSYFIALRDGTNYIKNKEYNKAIKLFEETGRRYNDQNLINISREMAIEYYKSKDPLPRYAHLFKAIGEASLTAAVIIYIVRKKKQEKKKEDRKS